MLSLAALAMSCGAGTVAPTPCMSDRECRGDRICHQGACMFEEEARAAMQEQLAGGPTEGGTPTEGTSAGGEDPTPAPVVLRELPMFMGGPTHAGRSERRGPAHAPQVAWTHRTGARVFASPVVGPDGTVYVGSLDRTFRAIAADGTLRWRYTGQDRFYSTAALTPDGTVVVGCHDRSVIALSAAGQTRWRRELGAAVDSSPVVAPDGTIYVTADGLYALDPQGNVLFHHAAPDALRSSPAIHPDGFVVYGSTDGRIVAVRADGQ
ncbi:MAG: PQQ-binding-like beta-propeller repeat protein, partial [Sandaracinaceae bacterium]